MFEKIIGKIKKTVDDTEQIDDRFYAQVMDELKQGFKDEAAVGKAIAQSDGNESKYNSLYVKIRAQTLQKKFKTWYHENKSLFLNLSNGHKDGYFHNLFRVEIEEKGFIVDSSNTIKKDGIKYGTAIDYEDMNFLIINKNNEILHRFHVKPN